MFLKAYDVFLISGKKLNLILGVDYAGPAFVNSVLKEQFLNILLTFSQYTIIT